MTNNVLHICVCVCVICVPWDVVFESSDTCGCGSASLRSGSRGWARIGPKCPTVFAVGIRYLWRGLFSYLSALQCLFPLPPVHWGVAASVGVWELGMGRAMWEWEGTAMGRSVSRQLPTPPPTRTRTHTIFFWRKLNNNFMRWECRD